MIPPPSTVEKLIQKYRLRLYLLHLVSFFIALWIVCIGYLFIEGYDARNNPKDFYITINILMGPGLIWLAHRKSSIMKFVALVSSLLVFGSNLLCYYLSYIKHPVARMTTYTTIKQRLLSIILVFDIIILVSHAIIVINSPTIISKWTRAGSSMKWWIQRQREKLDPRIKTS